MLSFLVLGDWGRRGSDAQRAVAAGMARAARRYDVDFVLSTGDNFYEHGVESIHDAHWCESFDAVYDDPALHVPWYAALGNHDHMGSVRSQIAYARRDVRWRLPDRYYSVSKQIDARTHAQFVVLDTTPFAEVEQMDATDRESYGTAYDPTLQGYWLRHMLAPSRSAWRIVVGHHPIRSAGSFHGDTPALRDQVDPLLRQYGVQAYFSGHEHDLQHLAEDGLHYVVSGVGSETRPTGTGPCSRFSRSTLGFAAVTLHPDIMELRFCDAEGTVCYETTIARETATRERVGTHETAETARAA
jgi:acid phosphatase